MKVIDPKQLPMRSPLVATLVFWLALDHWNAPGWAYGAVGVVMAVAWILWFATLYLNDHTKVDL